MQRSASLLVLAALASLFSLLGGCAAPEDEESEDEEMSASESALLGASKAAPACVKYSEPEKTVALRLARATNTCSYQVNVGLDLKGAKDRGCVVIPAGYSHDWTLVRGTTVTKIKSCS